MRSVLKSNRYCMGLLPMLVTVTLTGLWPVGVQAPTTPSSLRHFELPQLTTCPGPSVGLGPKKCVSPLSAITKTMTPPMPRATIVPIFKTPPLAEKADWHTLHYNNYYIRSIPIHSSHGQNQGCWKLRENQSQARAMPQTPQDRQITLLCKELALPFY